MWGVDIAEAVPIKALGQNPLAGIEVIWGR